MAVPARNFDHAGLKTISSMDLDNILNGFRGNENRVVGLVRDLTGTWLEEDVVAVLIKFGVEPEDFGYEVIDRKAARCDE